MGNSTESPLLSVLVLVSVFVRAEPRSSPSLKAARSCTSASVRWVCPELS